MHEHLYFSMKETHSISRRSLVRSSVLLMLAGFVPEPGYSHTGGEEKHSSMLSPGLPHDRYPAIPLSVASEVVGVAHFNLERLKELVDPRPELAKATWDWGFGDWESAMAAATHVGRRDIIDYLISKGAAPTLFTFALLGHYETVKAMITACPGIQKTLGPHGISLLQHAKTGLQADGVDKRNAQQLIDYLESLGDADGIKYLDMKEQEKAKYLGDYKYGEGEEDGFTIKLNMRKMLSLGKPGKSGGALYRIGENEFTYQGAPSVTVRFIIQNEKVISLILNEPGLELRASKR